MVQSELTVRLEDEAAFAGLAGQIAVAWRASAAALPLSFGLLGTLGAGKTAWVRGMLRGLGYRGRVPSPTYTLMEIYEIDDINLIHIDFYRIAEPRELEHLGLRDWLGRPGCWLFAEWPQNLPGWLAGCDLLLDIEVGEAQRRCLSWSARSEAGRTCLTAVRTAVGQ